MPRFVRVCRVDDLPDGAVRLLVADGTKLAVCRVGAAIHALSNYCPHLTGDLGAGKLDGDELVCPEHAWRFKVGSGRCTNVPGRSAHVFPVRIEDGWALVGV